MTRMLLLAGLTLGLTGPSVASAENPATIAVQRFAMVVGSNDGGTDRVQLRYAHSDALAMGDVLVDLGGVAHQDRIVLTDPDRAALERAFTVMRQRLEASDAPRTEVVFYYSGHSDETGLLLGGEHYGYKELREDVSELPAEVRIGILDSCSSGAMVRGKGSVRRAPFLVDASNEVKGYAYLTSSSADEAAQEADRIEGSFFTHALVTGLRGAADMSRDGKVTFNEAYQYAFHATLRGTERTSYGPQHPGYDIQMAGSGDLVLTDLRTTTASLALADNLRGRTSIRDGEGRLMVELEKPEGTPVELGLAPGDYTLIVRQADRFAEEPFSLRDGGTTTLAAEDLSWSRGELARARGGSVTTRDASLPESWFRMTFLPSVPTSDEVNDHLVLNWFVGRSAELQGLEASLGAYRVSGDASGAMATIGGNFVGGDLNGAQAAVGINQVSGDAAWFQATVGANVVNQRMTGFQGAVGLNYARQLDGVQFSQGVNVAQEMDGTQIGVVNVSMKAKGAQLGLVNVGGEVKGTQLGLINVAERSDAPIGLLSFVKEGRHSIAIAGGSDVPYNAELKLGGTRLYNVFGAGSDGFCSDPNRTDCAQATKMYLQYGLGGKLTQGERAWFDLDLGVASYMPVDEYIGPRWGQTTLVPRARVSFELLLFGHLAPYLGAAFNLQVPINELGISAVPEDLDQCLDGVCSMFWPSGFAGVALEF
jgi:hypothetical protein